MENSVTLTKEELMKMKAEREQQKTRLDVIYSQLNGQIGFIDDLLKKMEPKVEEKPEEKK